MFKKSRRVTGARIGASFFLKLDGSATTWISLVVNGIEPVVAVVVVGLAVVIGGVVGIVGECVVTEVVVDCDGNIVVAACVVGFTVVVTGDVAGKTVAKVVGKVVASFSCKERIVDTSVGVNSLDSVG